MSAYDKTSSAQKNKGKAPALKAEGPSSKKITVEALVSSPVYNFASDVSQEFREQVEALTQSMAKHMDNTLAMNAMGGDSTKAFSSTRDGDVVHLVYPGLVKDGDLLAGLITVLAALIPSCVIHKSDASWSEPEWTGESRAHLSGLISGLYRVPDSFAHSSSPTELARISMWITACSAALSVPGGVADAQGDVLPSAVAGGKSASKYMTKILAGLRSNVSDESMSQAINTLAILLKMWQKTQARTALAILRKCKIGWSTVLFRGAPTTIIKGKKNKPDQTVVRSPPKPSKSPWLSKAERSELGNIYKDDWSRTDRFRDTWVALSSEEQHVKFNETVKALKAHYEYLNNTSNSIHAKLGKRKHWIERVCKEDEFKPKVKKDESASFALADHFFQKKLSNSQMSIKKLFSPLTYLPDFPGEQSMLETWNSLIPSTEQPSRISSADFSLDEEGRSYRLWQIWADMFLPVFTINAAETEEPQPSVDNNFFKALFGIGQG